LLKGLSFGDHLILERSVTKVLEKKAKKPKVTLPIFIVASFSLIPVCFQPYPLEFPCISTFLLKNSIVLQQGWRGGGLHMFNAIAHSGVKIDARANINSTSDPTSPIPTAFLCPEMSLLRERRGIISHFCLTFDLARRAQCPPTNRWNEQFMSIDSLYRIGESHRVFSLINLKRLVPLLLRNIKLSSVKLSCQDQRTQTFLKLPRYCKTQN